MSELSDFIEAVWPKEHGDSATLVPWLRKAEIAFPGVDLLHEARKAALWESERPSNKKRSARRFLRNWWGRTHERGVSVAPVVCLSAVRWLSKHNKAPDYLFESWARDKAITAESVLSFCSYMGIPHPDDASEVVSVFLKGV